MTYRKFKRLMDLFLALVLFVLLLPLMILIGVLALAFHGRPILFVQVRPGLHERPFRLVKFRTMSHENAGWHGASDQDSTTRFGRILRAMSLDELPQLLNIIIGDMSFVGPRPLLVEYLPLYSTSQKKRHNVRPGLTGLAQVEGRNRISWEQRLTLDSDYAANYCMRLDLAILLKTVVLVLTQYGVNAEGKKMMSPFNGD